MLLFAPLLMAQESRIKMQQSDPIVTPPLKQALGELEYKEAMSSKKYEFVGNNKCRFCHRKFFIGRKKDPHDGAMNSLRAINEQDNQKCLPCHSTGHGVESGFVSTEKTPRLANVQCEGCHGPGNIHIAIAKKTRKGGGFLAGTDRPSVIKKMCKSCHTARWDRSYKNFEEAYNKYKKPDPNKQ